MNINLKQLEAFVQVVDQGNFRKAAARLHTTQPNISSRIAALESSLEVQLMERHAGSINLTAKGAELLTHAREVLRAADKLIDAADQPALYDGILRLGVTELVVHTWLHPFLKRVKQVYPNLSVELTVELAIDLRQALHSHTLDLAIHSGPFETACGNSQDTEGFEQLGNYPLTWVAAPELGLAANKPVTLEQLAAYPILTHARSTRPYLEITEHFSRQHKLNVRIVPSSNLAACAQMTIDAMGVAALPEAMIRTALNNAQLEKFVYPWVPSDLEFRARFNRQTAPAFVSKVAKIARTVANDCQSTLETD